MMILDVCVDHMNGSGHVAWSPLFACVCARARAYIIYLIYVYIYIICIYPYLRVATSVVAHTYTFAPHTHTHTHTHTHIHTHTHTHTHTGGELEQGCQDDSGAGRILVSGRLADEATCKYDWQKQPEAIAAAAGSGRAGGPGTAVCAHLCK